MKTDNFIVHSSKILDNTISLAHKRGMKVFAFYDNVAVEILQEQIYQQPVAIITTTCIEEATRIMQLELDMQETYQKQADSVNALSQLSLLDMKVPRGLEDLIESMGNLSQLPQITQDIINQKKELRKKIL